MWRDEAATMRPLPALLGMLTNVDAVHGAYHLLVWPLVHTIGGSELTLRVPAALAMAGAALGVAALGRRLHSPGTGLLAGLLFAVLPQVSRYGGAVVRLRGGVRGVGDLSPQQAGACRVCWACGVRPYTCGLT
jgi:hypothetical protein